MTNCNNHELLEKAYYYLDKNGRGSYSWYDLAKMFNIKNLSGGCGSDTLRAAYTNYKKRSKGVDNFIDHANIVKVKRWEVKDGDVRESVHYVNSENQENKEFEKLKDGLLKDIKKKSPKVSKRKFLKSYDPVLIEINLPDLHFGRYDGKTLDEQSRLFLDSVVELNKKASGYDIDRYLVVLANDMLNSEGFRQTTTKGTPQHDNDVWQNTFVKAWKSCTWAIDYLCQYAPVDVLIVPGNHDYERSFYMGETLVAYYNNNKNVTVNNNKDASKYYSYGINLLGFDHGDKIKPQDLPLVMATDRPKEFSQSKYRAWHIGHVHKHMLNEYRGVEVRVLPTLCGADSWTKKMGYHSERRAQAYIWSKLNGPEGYIQINK